MKLLVKFVSLVKTKQLNEKRRNTNKQTANNMSYIIFVLKTSLMITNTQNPNPKTLENKNLNKSSSSKQHFFPYKKARKHNKTTDFFIYFLKFS